MKITSEEIAMELQKMGIEGARERITFFQDQGAISDMEYIRLWHLVNGGDPKRATIGKTSLFTGDNGPDAETRTEIDIITLLVFSMIIIGIVMLIVSAS